MTAKHVRMRAALLATAIVLVVAGAAANDPDRRGADRLRPDATMRRTSCQAARALQQINNRSPSLQNQTQMLLNQARNLASLPLSSLQQLQQSIQHTQQLLGQAQHIAYDVQQIDQAFSTTYGAGSTLCARSAR